MEGTVLNAESSRDPGAWKADRQPSFLQKKKKKKKKRRGLGQEGDGDTPGLHFPEDLGGWVSQVRSLEFGR